MIKYRKAQLNIGKHDLIQESTIKYRKAQLNTGKNA